MKRKIEKEIVKIGVKIAKSNEGALFVVSDTCEYDEMMSPKLIPFTIFEPGADKLLEQLAKVDGSIIISKKGYVRAYGARIRDNKTILLGKGTRHQSAVSASLYPDSVAYLISQEEKKIKVFTNGKETSKLDALEKNIENNYNEAIKILESLGFGTIASVGSVVVASNIPAGVVIAPGILVTGLAYWIFKKFK